jgi:hypothetical protein
MSEQATKTYNAAYDRAARVRGELLDGLRRLRDDLRGATASELEHLARLRRELDLLAVILDVDVLR